MKNLKRYMVGMSIVMFSFVSSMINITPLVVQASEDVNKNETNSGLTAKVLYDNAITQIGSAKVNDLSQCKKAIDSGTLKIAFVGDSITEGVNLFDLKNNYPNQVLAKLKQALPNINIEMRNFSMGGRASVHFVDDNYKANDVETNYNVNFNRPWSVIGKSWKEHVKEFSPDLMIIAFGMNDAFNTKNSDELFYNNIKRIADDTKNWPVVPNLVFVSTILPTVNKAVYDQRQDITNEVAIVTRNFAKENGYICADANRLFQILRDGKDSLGAISTDFEEASKVSNFYNGTVEFEATFKKVGLDGSREIVYRQNDLGSTIIRLEASDNDTGMASIYFSDNDSIFDPSVKLGEKNINNAVDDEGNNIVVITDKNDNEIKPIKKVSIPNIKLDTAYKVKIDVNDIHHNVYINDSLVLSLDIYKKLSPGKVNIKANGVKAFELKNLKIKAIEPLKVTPLYSEEELIGSVNTPLNEGNGINHPNTLGHSIIYVPAFNGVIKQLTDIYENRSLD